MYKISTNYACKYLFGDGYMTKTESNYVIRFKKLFEETNCR